jgi:hypothetical protein
MDEAHARKRGPKRSTTSTVTGTISLRSVKKQIAAHWQAPYSACSPLLVFHAGCRGGCRDAGGRGGSRAVVQRAGQVKAEKQCCREPVNCVAAVGDGDAPVAPAVATTLPLPTARRRVNNCAQASSAASRGVRPCPAAATPVRFVARAYGAIQPMWAFASASLPGLSGPSIT